MCASLMTWVRQRQGQVELPPRSVTGKNPLTNPTRVVFGNPGVVGECRPHLSSVILIVQVVPRPRLNARACYHVKVGVLVPARNPEKEITFHSTAFRGQVVRGELERQFITAGNGDQRVV